MPEFRDWAAHILPELVAALVLLVAGVWLARWAERAFVGLLERHKIVDPTFRGVLSSLVRYSILLLAGLAAMQQLGFQTTSILAALGAILVAIGLALQGTLSNLAAGLMLLWLRPFRVDDVIETASVSGSVVEVGLFATEIRRVDGVYVFVPNTDLWNKPLANVSRLPARMIDLKFTIKRGCDVEAARQCLLATAMAEDLVRKSPPPAVHVSGLADAGPVLSLQAWVDSANFRLASLRLVEQATTALLHHETTRPRASEQPTE